MRLLRKQEHIRMGAVGVRVCNFVKFEAGQNLPSVLKIVTHIVHAV